jgi:hypothetical protein
VPDEPNLKSNETAHSESGASKAPDGIETQPVTQGAPPVPGPIETQPISQILCSKDWWQNTLLTVYAFIPQCLLPAIVWSAATTLLIGGGWFAITHMTNNGVFSLEGYLVSVAVALVTIIVSLLLMAWALGIWLIKITAYSRAFMQLAVAGGSLTRATIKAVQSECVAQTWQRRIYIARFWFYITVFMLAPLALMSILFLVKGANSTEFSGVKLLSLTPLANGIIVASLAFLSLVLTQVSLVAVAISSRSSLEAFSAAKETMRLCWRYGLPGFIITTALVVLNVVVASPQVLFKLNNLDAMYALPSNVWQMLVETIWQGMSSVFLWTVTMAPICELLRNRIK